MSKLPPDSDQALDTEKSQDFLSRSIDWANSEEFFNQLQDDILSLKGKDRVSALMNLLAYTHPKVSSRDAQLEAHGTHIINISLNPDERKETDAD